MPMATPEAQREYQRQWMARRRADYFADKICVDCGSAENLQLDHVDRSQKVSHRIWSWSAERRAIELEKCVVRCGTCHKIKTKLHRDYVNATNEKLTIEQVLEIRSLYASGGVTQQMLADRYKVGQQHISWLILGNGWG